MIHHRERIIGNSSIVLNVLSYNLVSMDQFDKVEISRSSIVFFARVEQFDSKYE